MNISKPFIERPVATTLLTVAVALAGVVGYSVLPVSPLPQVDFPTINVNASLPGASPETMASAVATPLERQFGRIAAVTEMTSTSTLGGCSITLQFDLNRDINAAARDVQAGIAAARGYLPANLPSNPNYRKSNPADAPIFQIALTSSVLSKGEMYDAASTIMAQKLSQVKGVGQVFTFGSALPGVRVELNPMAVNKYGIGLEDVRSTLNTANANVPKGHFSDGQRVWEVASSDQIFKARQYAPLIVAYRNGAAVRVSDVAEVVDSVEDLRNAGYANGRPSVVVTINRQPGANIIDTVDHIRDMLPQLKAAIPQSIDLTVTQDQTQTIRASVHDVEVTLVISIALVILVVFVFLRDVRTTFIPSVAVPVSLIGTFGVMYLCGYSIDNLSLMALTISTGFVVDDAIVVIENITRYLEQGMKPFAAALKGAEEIGFTVLTISISLVAVFIPLLFMGGIVGRLFREFAVTLSTAIVVSMIISLTTTPMMCAFLLRNERGQKHGRIYQFNERAFDKLLGLYRRSLHWVLEHAALTLTVLLLTVALNVVLVIVIPKGFFPQQDTGAITGGVQGPQDSSFPAMNNSIQQIVGVIKNDAAVANVIAFTGGGGATNTGFIYIALKPLSQRKVSAAQVIGRLRPQLNRLPVASAFLQAAQDLRIGGRASNAMYQYTLQSDNSQDLFKWGPVLLKEMKRLPGLQDVNSDQQNGGLDELLTYDRTTAAKLGQTVQSLDSTLYSAFGQSEVSFIYTQLNQYYVVMEVAPQYWQSPEGLKDIYLQSPGNRSIPLSAIATGRATTTALAVNHTGLFPSVTASFNLASNVSLSEATLSINQMQQRLGTPATISGFFAGTLLAYQQSL